MTARLSEIIHRLQAQIERGDVDGAGLLVLQGGQPMLEWYGGEAAPGLPAGPDVLWPLASISKLYTAAIIMALIERGELALELPAYLWVPELEDERRAITIRHLLTHTSGLLYEPPEMIALLQQRASLEELVEPAFSEALLFAPGSRIAYSDLAYAVLGLVAERAGGRSFPELLRTLVLEPAGLEKTFCPLPRSEANRVARIVGGIGEGQPWAMYSAEYGLQLAHPAWGVVATLRDLVRFLICFTPHAPTRILSQATIRAMTRRQTADSLGSPGWGLGFEVESGYFGEVTLMSPGCFGHTGATGCAAWYDPVADVTIGFVSNRHLNTGRERFIWRIAAVLDGVVAAVT